MPTGNKQELLELQGMLARGNVEDAHEVIAEGDISPMLFNDVGYALAYYAVCNNQPACLHMLAAPDVGVDLQAPCSSPKLEGATPAHVAVSNDLPDCIRTLHELGVDMERPADKLGNHPAKIAVAKGSASCLAPLQTAGVDLDAYSDKHGCKLAFFAAAQDHPHVLTELARLGVALDKVCDRLGFTPACYASTHNTRASLMALYDAGVDLSAPCDRWGGRPVKYAVLESANDCLKALYLAGVDLRAPCDKYGASPCEFALAQGNDEAAELIDKMLLPAEQKPWKCKGCSVENKPAAEFCQLCGEPCGSNPERVLVPH